MKVGGGGGGGGIEGPWSNRHLREGQSRERPVSTHRAGFATEPT